MSMDSNDFNDLLEKLKNYHRPNKTYIQCILNAANDMSIDTDDISGSMYYGVLKKDKKVRKAFEAWEKAGNSFEIKSNESANLDKKQYRNIQYKRFQEEGKKNSDLYKIYVENAYRMFASTLESIRTKDRGNPPQGYSPNELYQAIANNFKTDEELIQYADYLLYYINKANLPIPDSFRDKIMFINGEEKFSHKIFRNFFLDIYNDETYNSLKSIKALPNDNDGKVKILYDRDLLLDQNIVIGDKSFSILNDTDELLKKLKKDRKIFIFGEGGMGKTVALNLLAEAASSAHEKFSYVVSLSLSSFKPFEVTSQNTNWAFFEKNTDVPFEIIEKLANPGLSYTYNTGLPGDSKWIKPVLFLLDGYNELLSYVDNDVKNQIKKEIEKICKFWNAVVVITSRPLSLNKNNRIIGYGDAFSDFSVARLSGTPKEKVDSCLTTYPELSEEIKNLIKIPMYYELLVKLGSTQNGIPTDEYDMFKKVYLKYCMQNIRFAGSSDESRAYYFIYFFIIPKISQEMSMRSLDRLHENEVEAIVKSFLTKTIYSSILFKHCLPSIDVTPSFDANDYNGDVILNILRFDGFLVTDENNCCRFSSNFYHENWRDFLAAFAVNSMLECYLKNYKNDRFANESELYVNISDKAAGFVKKHFGLQKDENTETTFRALFSPLYQDERCSIGIIKLCYICFVLTDNLPILFNNKEKNDILSEILYRVLRQVMIFDNCGSILSKCKEEAFSIFAKACECCRVKKRFDDCEKYIEFCEAHVGKDNQRILNQKASLCFAKYEDSVLNGQCDSDKSLLFKNGISILEKNIKENKFNLSSNLLGMLLSYPAPYLLESGAISEIDAPRAFWEYYNVIINGSGRGRTSVYTIRQAVGLILKGLVKVDVNNEFIERVGNGEYLHILGKDQFAKGGNNPLKIDEVSLKLVNYLLSFAEGQDIKVINYYRGVACFLENKNDEAKYFFEKDGSLLSKIFMCYAFGLEEKDIIFDEITNIACEINELESNRYNKYHPIYRYFDAKNLILAFNPNENKRFFGNVEERFSMTCKNLLERIEK